MPTPHSPRQNHLIAALPAVEFERLAAHLELVPLPLGEMLYEPGDQLKHAYFPTTAIVSLHYVTKSGASAESAVVGNDGVVGIALFTGGNTTPRSAALQTGATPTGWRAACYRSHSVEQQLCRWLLLTLDGVSSRELIMTQELIAGMLGVRRESINDAAGKPQDAGLIRYRRGHIAVLERSGLETRACECYAVIREEIGRLLSDLQNRQGVPPASAALAAASASHSGR